MLITHIEGDAAQVDFARWVWGLNSNAQMLDKDAWPVMASQHLIGLAAFSTYLALQARHWCAAGSSQMLVCLLNLVSAGGAFEVA